MIPKRPITTITVQAHIGTAANVSTSVHALCGSESAKSMAHMNDNRLLNRLPGAQLEVVSLQSHPRVAINADDGGALENWGIKL